MILKILNAKSKKAIGLLALLASLDFVGGHAQNRTGIKGFAII